MFLQRLWSSQSKRQRSDPSPTIYTWVQCLLFVQCRWLCFFTPFLFTLCYVAHLLTVCLRAAGIFSCVGMLSPLVNLLGTYLLMSIYVFQAFEFCSSSYSTHPLLRCGLQNSVRSSTLELYCKSPYRLDETLFPLFGLQSEYSSCLKSYSPLISKWVWSCCIASQTHAHTSQSSI